MNRINFIYNTKGLFHMFLYAPAGSIYETTGKTGISHVLEHMLLKRTKQFSEQELLKEITTLGGTNNGATDRDICYYYIMTHMDNYRKTIDILSSVMNEPLFTNDELTIEKKIVLEEIKQRHDRDGDLYNLSYLTILAQNNLYSLPIEGQIEDIKKLTPKDLYDFYKKHYSDFMIVINCDEKEKNIIEKYIISKFGHNKQLNFNEISTMYGSLDFTSKIVVVNRNNEQYTTNIVFPSFPRSMIREGIILNFIKYCLVSAGLYGILTYQLRSKRGLIYSIRSMNETYRYIGLLRFIVSTSNKNTFNIIDTILDIIIKFKKNGLSNKLMKFFKKGFLNEQKYALTSDDFKTIYHGESIFYGCDISDDEYIKIIKNITNDDIKEISEKVFDVSKLGILTYGKYDDKLGKHFKNGINDVLMKFM